MARLGMLASNRRNLVSVALYYNCSKCFNNVIENYYHIVIKINSCKLFKKEMLSIAF